MPTPLPDQGGLSCAPHVLVLAPDLEDSALWRRVSMLRVGGATVRVCGFRRDDRPLQEVAEVLGRTRNGAMLQRAVAVLRAAPRLARLLWRGEADVVLARNLEMLLLGRLACALLRGSPRLVYEVLDIHRLMLGQGLLSRGLRALERSLTARAALILTSSPGFVRAYFGPIARLSPPVLVVENRSFAPRPTPVAFVASNAPPAPPQGPLIIGWFGILRCAASLACLDALTRAAPGRFRVVMRGRPARDVMADFDAVVAANPDLQFEGPYRNPDDLAHIYGAVHLVWAVDRYEAGGNSDWLLPNRIYEGGLYGAVPVALDGTETARFLSSRGIGVVLRGLDQAEVSRCLGTITGTTLTDLRARVLGCPPQTWVATDGDALALVQALTRPGAAPASASGFQVLTAEGPPA